MQRGTSDRWSRLLGRATLTAALLAAAVLSAGSAAADDGRSGANAGAIGGPDGRHDDGEGRDDDDDGRRGDGRRVQADLVAARLPQSSACQGSVCNTATVGAVTTVSGDLRGAMFGGGTSVNDGVAPVSVGLGRFTGEIDGCGGGSFAMVTELRLPLADPSGARSTWHIVPGSGTDELEGITGGGTATGTITPTELRSHITGAVRC